MCDEDNRKYVPLVNALIREIYALAKQSEYDFNFFLDEAEVLLPSLDEDFTYLFRGANKNGISFILSIHDEEMLTNKLGKYILKLADIVDTES